ncbi:MAG: hypothetical protein PHF31_10765 [Methylobacter sp.]|nr:hypothetical protein [Methylobacter sp.]
MFNTKWHCRFSANGTTAWMQKVEQRREQLPRNATMNAWLKLLITEAASLLAVDVEQHQRGLS